MEECGYGGAGVDSRNHAALESIEENADVHVDGYDFGRYKKARPLEVRSSNVRP